MKDTMQHPSLLKGYKDAICGQRKAFNSFKQDLSRKYYRVGWTMGMRDVLEAEFEAQGAPEIKL